MSSPDRRWILRAALVPAILPLAGCFRPMLAEGSAGRGVVGRVAFPNTDDRFGYFLVKSLGDRLGEPGETDWSLTVQNRITDSDQAIAQDNSVTRVTVTAVSRWQLRRRSNGEVVLSDTAISQSGYNATTSLFATRQAELDIERRLARDIGERIARRILANAETLDG
ncbi:MAG: LPS assembly lipoprotein LptE [Pseudomonadota bacterium]